MDMNTLLILILLLGVAFLVYKRYTAKKKQKLIDEPSNSTELRLENVTSEGVLTLEGVKNGVENLDLVVSAKHLYKNEGYEWYELIADSGERSYSIEYEVDDEIEIRLSQKSLKLRDLAINRDQLMLMADEEEGEIQFDDISYYFDEKGEYTFHRNCDLQKGESFSLMEFVSKDGANFLTIEFWGGGETEVTQSIAIDPDCVKVYSLGNKELK